MAPRDLERTALTDHRITVWANMATSRAAPNSEKNPTNLCEVMKRNPEFMAKASLASFQARPAG
jgi:hypothetical protein